jgi:hypothetical protein
MRPLLLLFLVSLAPGPGLSRNPGKENLEVGENQASDAPGALQATQPGDGFSMLSYFSTVPDNLMIYHVKTFIFS